MLGLGRFRRRHGVTVRLLPQNGSSAHGTARLFFVGRHTLRVELFLRGLEPGSRHPAHIHFGTCAGGGPIGYPLRDVVAGPDGEGRSVTDVADIFVIPPAGWYVNVHRGPTLADGGAVPIACGDVALARPVWP